MQKGQSIPQRYGKPKCNYEQAGSLIGLDVGIKTGVGVWVVIGHRPLIGDDGEL